MSNSSYTLRLTKDSEAEWDSLGDQFVRRASHFTLDLDSFAKALAAFKDHQEGITEWCKLVKSEGPFLVCFFPRPDKIGGKSGGKFGATLLVDHAHRNAWILRLHSPQSEFDEAAEDKFARESFADWDGRKE